MGAREGLAIEALVTPLGQSLVPPVYKRGHSYGDLYVAASYCGLPKPPPTSLAFEWQHGWIPSFLDLSPEGVVGTDGLSYLRKHTHSQLVATKKHADFLTDSGYDRAVPIGLPFLYVPPQGFRRAKEHSLYVFSHTTYSDLSRHEKAIMQINHIADRASETDKYMMIHGANLSSETVRYARQKGIRILLGADDADINSLVRVRQIFESFGTLKTDCIGSHVLYALISGMTIQFVQSDRRVSPYSTLPEGEIYKNSPCALSDVEQYKIMYSSPKYLTRLLADAGIVDELSALREAGAESKLTPKELSRLLGWGSLPVNVLRVLKAKVVGNLWLIKKFKRHLI